MNLILSHVTVWGCALAGIFIIAKRAAAIHGVVPGREQETMQAKRLQIKGRVQGVGYRAWIMQEATKLGLHGWVRNRIDGSVETLLYGEIDAVEELARACRRGPQLAMVSEIDEFLDEPPDHPGFKMFSTV